MIFDTRMMSEWDHGLCQVSVNGTRYLLEEEQLLEELALSWVCSHVGLGVSSLTVNSWIPAPLVAQAGAAASF